MEKVYYNKLCRDRMPELIAEKGFDCDVREMNHDEYRREIVRKVFEEAGGVSNHADRETLLKELSDLLITIDALKTEYDITDSELESAISRSLAEKGGFSRRLFLSWSSDVAYSPHDKKVSIDD
jgi:predicted house-cleaning noncanonical NTP pyrophosphatase (MazG superfamily)